MLRSNRDKTKTGNFLSFFIYIFTVIFTVTCCFFPLSAAAEEYTAGTGGGAAVTGRARDTGYGMTLYNADNGLPTSETNVVYAASDGFIWIGGLSGLIRYDGTSFEHQDSSGGITSVTALYGDSKDRLWVGTNENGVVCLYNDHSEHYSYDDGVLSSSVCAFAEDRNGNILVSTKQGLCYFDENMDIHPVIDLPLEDTYISQMAADAGGAICCLTKNGALFRLKDMRMTDYYIGSDLGTDTITAILPSDGIVGEIWFGTRTGMICRGSFNDNFRNIERKQLFYTETAADPDNGGDHASSEDSAQTRIVPASEPVKRLFSASGSIWALMDGTVFYTDADDEFRLFEKNPLDESIEYLTEDFEGNIWIASKDLGVMKITANNFFDLSGHAGLEPETVNTTCVRDGLIYIGTDSGLRIVDRLFAPVENELTDLLGSSRITCISEDHDKNLWISTCDDDQGLICYTPRYRITHYTIDEGMPDNDINCTAVAPDGTVLAAAGSSLAVIRHGRIVDILDESSGLSNTAILTVEATDDGKYYIGTDGDGIYAADGESIAHLSLDDGLTSYIIPRIKNDPQRNVIWIITSNSVEYIKDNKIHYVKGFPYTNNYDIYFDNGGNAWVLASNGIYVGGAQEMIENEQTDYVFYNAADGLPSVPAGNSFSWLDENGDLYIAGTSGVSRVNIDSSFEHSGDIRFSVQYIEDENGRYYPDKTGTFTLPPSARNITIYGYALTYIMHDPMIQYYLDGSDNKPIVVNKSDMAPVRYTNLRGGTYEYKLSLIDGSTHDVRQTETFRIIKKRAFYEQWWFYIICAALLLFLAITVIMLIVRQYLKRKTAIFRIKEEEQNKLQRLFGQTVTALVNSIDAKDRYTHGHSRRVAEYSKMIAEQLGKSKEEVDNIYLAAIMHDVGKIGVPDAIINKEGKLTDEEFEAIKRHPSIGAQILSGISYSPYLSIGANYHHERYDGRGYPDHLKGDDIPEAARIIAVADAYDAMTSKRSYRDPIPQQLVREEMIKGSGTQFDPEFAKIMTHLIDIDSEYQMKERGEVRELAGKNELYCGEYRESFSEGIHIASNIVKLHMRAKTDKGYSPLTCIPSLILFDSLDGRIHTEEPDRSSLLYFEYAAVRLDGSTECAGARKSKTETTELAPLNSDAIKEIEEKGLEYDIEAMKHRDHVMIRIVTKYRRHEVIIANPDSSRYTYISLTGEHCLLSDVNIKTTGKVTPSNGIPRIAEEVSYIADAPEGDIPNVQVDDWCSDATKGIPVTDGMKITFHAQSLPTARLIWHCPFVILFYSEDKRFRGKNFHDFAAIRFDGEFWDREGEVDDKAVVSIGEDFNGWNDWKASFKQGIDCEVEFRREGNRIIVTTENRGISIKNTTSVNYDVPEIYAALSGDQIAITNIRIS